MLIEQRLRLNPIYLTTANQRQDLNLERRDDPSFESREAHDDLQVSLQPAKSSPTVWEASLSPMTQTSAKLGQSYGTSPRACRCRLSSQLCGMLEPACLGQFPVRKKLVPRWRLGIYICYHKVLSHGVLT